MSNAIARKRSNTQLALLISKLGVTADAETIHAHGKHRPDVLFQLRGLRVVIESKFKDTPNAEQVVLDDARKRVRAGVAHIAAATVYPDELRTARTTKLFDTLEDARLRGRPGLRLRVGPWRVIFERDEEARKIDVLRIGPRGDVYKELGGTP